MIASLSGCGKTNGTGFVEGFFAVEECRRSGNRAPAPYEFEASRLATQRVFDVLEIHVLEYAVHIEQTDGLIIRMPRVSEARQRRERPLELPVSRDSADVNAALSLFQTCPDRPTLTAIEGTLSLTKFAIAANPEDTGDQELVAGTLTATVVGPDPEVRVGWIRAQFDFLPERAPVTGPRP